MNANNEIVVPRLSEDEQEALREGMKIIAAEKEAAEEGLESRNENSTVQQLSSQSTAKKEHGAARGYYDRLRRKQEIEKLQRKQRAVHRCSKCQKLQKTVAEYKQFIEEKMEEIQQLKNGWSKDQEKLRKLQEQEDNSKRFLHLKKEIRDLQQLAANRQHETQIVQKQLLQQRVNYNKLKDLYDSKKVRLACCEAKAQNFFTEITHLKEEQLELVRQCIGDEQENQKLERIIRDMLFRLSQLGGPQEAEDWVNDYTGLNGYDPRDN